MFKFVLKSALLASLLGGAAIATFGPDKLKNWAREGKEKVEQEINEFKGMTSELHKVESRVQQLEAEIQELKENALREELEVGNLQKEVDSREESLENLRENLEKAQGLLNSDQARFNIRGITYTRSEVEQDVAEKMRIYTVQQETLAQLRQTLLTRHNSLDIARENVARGQAVREELVAKVRLLEAQLERYNARQVYAEAVAMDFDAREFNTRIGEARALLAKFEQKLAVKNRMLDDQIRVSNEAGHVAGIDYSSEAAAPASVREQLAALLEAALNPTETAPGSLAAADR